MSKIEGPSGSINNIVCQTLNIIIRPTELLVNYSSNNKHSVRPFYFFYLRQQSFCLACRFLWFLFYIELYNCRGSGRWWWRSGVMVPGHCLVPSLIQQLVLLLYYTVPRLVPLSRLTPQHQQSSWTTRVQHSHQLSYAIKIQRKARNVPLVV